MKILEAQSATLTNYEVYAHLTEQKRRYRDKKNEKSYRPTNLDTIVNELLAYLREAPSPLGSRPFPYNEATIRNLLVRLRQWDFTKAEILMIMNLRPTKPENLNVIVEQMEERFPGDELQLEIVATITEVLGKPDGSAEREAMASNAQYARQEDEEGYEYDEDMQIVVGIGGNPKKK